MARLRLFVKVYDSRRGVGVRARALDCDTVYISGRNQEDVTSAATVIVTNARAVVNGTPPSGPQIKVTCPTNAVACVIGKGGNGLHKIQKTAGDYCHIHYNRDDALFEITAQTQAACDRARIYIGQAIRDFMKPQQQVVLSTASSLLRGVDFRSLKVEGSDSEDEREGETQEPNSPLRTSSASVEANEGGLFSHIQVTSILEEHLVGIVQSTNQELVNGRGFIAHDFGASSPPATDSTSPLYTDTIESTTLAPEKPKRRKKLTLVAMTQPVF